MYIFLATARVMKPSGSYEKDNGGWWADLPDWLMRREKPHIAVSLGRCGARYTSSIICAPRSVVPCTARLLTTRMSQTESSANPAKSIGASGCWRRLSGNGKSAKEVFQIIRDGVDFLPNLFFFRENHPLARFFGGKLFFATT
jgi:hypothetical protein